MQPPIRLIAAVMILIAAVHGVAHAQSADTLEMSLGRAIERARTMHPELLYQRAGIESARAEARRADVLFPEPMEFESSFLADAPFNLNQGHEWEIALSQQIETGGQRSLRRQIAAADLMSDQAGLHAAELQVISRVRYSYVDLVAARDWLQLLDTLAGFAIRLDTVAGRLLEVGEISELERNALKIERARAELERIEARTRLAGANAELVALLALPPATTVVPAGDRNSVVDPRVLDSLVHIHARVASGDTALLRRRPEWQELAYRAERLAAERRLAQRRLWPDLNIGLSYASGVSVLDGADISPGGEPLRSGFGELRSQDRTLGLHLGLRMFLPFGRLYDYGAVDAEVADARLAALDAERRMIQTRIAADLSEAIARLRGAVETHRIYTETISPLVKRNLYLLELGFLEGEFGATEVITQQAGLVAAAGAGIEAQREYARALAEIERIIGVNQ